MALIRTYLRKALGAGLTCALVLLASPTLWASSSDEVSYADMKDAELTQALQTWGTLQSSERRELLVELKKRMERSQGLETQVSAPQAQAQSRAPRITIYIHVRKSMRFGAGIDTGVDTGVDNHIGNLRPGGVVVMRGGVSGGVNDGVHDSVRTVGDARLAAQEMLQHMRRLIANAKPLPGPGFGDGFERRQAFMQASIGSIDKPAGDNLNHFRASTSASGAGQEETHLRDE